MANMKNTALFHLYTRPAPYDDSGIIGTQRYIRKLVDITCIPLKIVLEINKLLIIINNKKIQIKIELNAMSRRNLDVFSYFMGYQLPIIGKNVKKANNVVMINPPCVKRNRHFRSVNQVPIQPTKPMPANTSAMETIPITGSLKRIISKDMRIKFINIKRPICTMLVSLRSYFFVASLSGKAM